MEKLENLENKYMDFFVSRFDGNVRKAFFITNNVLPALEKEVEQQRKALVNETERLLNERENARKEQDNKEV